MINCSLAFTNKPHSYFTITHCGQMSAPNSNKYLKSTQCTLTDGNHRHRRRRC